MSNDLLGNLKGAKRADSLAAVQSMNEGEINTFFRRKDVLDFLKEAKTDRKKAMALKFAFHPDKHPGNEDFFTDIFNKLGLVLDGKSAFDVFGVEDPNKSASQENAPSGNNPTWQRPKASQTGQQHSGNRGGDSGGYRSDSYKQEQQRRYEEMRNKHQAQRRRQQEAERQAEFRRQQEILRKQQERLWRQFGGYFQEENSEQYSEQSRPSYDWSVYRPYSTKNVNYDWSDAVPRYSYGEYAGFGGDFASGYSSRRRDFRQQQSENSFASSRGSVSDDLSDLLKNSRKRSRNIRREHKRAKTSSSNDTRRSGVRKSFNNKSFASQPRASKKRTGGYNSPNFEQKRKSFYDAFKLLGEILEVFGRESVLKRSNSERSKKSDLGNAQPRGNKKLRKKYGVLRARKNLLKVRKVISKTGRDTSSFLKKLNKTSSKGNKGSAASAVFKRRFGGFEATGSFSKGKKEKINNVGANNSFFRKNPRQKVMENLDKARREINNKGADISSVGVAMFVMIAGANKRFGDKYLDDLMKNDFAKLSYGCKYNDLHSLNKSEISLYVRKLEQFDDIFKKLCKKSNLRNSDYLPLAIRDIGVGILKQYFKGDNKMVEKIEIMDKRLNTPTSRPNAGSKEGFGYEKFSSTKASYSKC